MKRIALFLALALSLAATACAAPRTSISESETKNEPPMSEVEPSETPKNPPTQPLPDGNSSHPEEPEIPEEPQAPEGPEVFEEPAKVRYLAVEADGLNVRTGAGTDRGVLGVAQRGTLLPLCGEADGWCETRYRGKIAYVSAHYTSQREFSCGETAVEAVIREGCRLLGTPYVYGATRLHDGRGRLLGGFTEEAFDCSSLMQYIFYRGAGVLLDVTTRTQIAQGMHVDGELRRGDLMFFTNASRKDRAGIERVGHVALYLGDGYILHTASDFAKIEKISPLRQSYFLEARRIL